MLSRPLLLVLACGCGRINFDPLGGDDQPGGGDGGTNDASGPGVMCVGTATPSCPVNAQTISTFGSHLSSGPSDNRGDGFSGSCGGAGADEQTVEFIVQQSGTYIFNTLGSTYDTVLYIRDGSCTGPELGCSDNFMGMPTSKLTLTLAAGQRVVAFIDGANGLCGTYMFRAGTNL